MGALNRVIEERAFKQVEDMIVLIEMLSEQIIATSKTAKANQISFSTPSTSNGDMNKKLTESRAIVLKLQADYKELQKSYDSLVKKVENYTTAKKNNTVAITNNSVAQSQLLKLTKEEEVLNTGLTTYIQKLSVERIRASRTVADYNAQIAMGTALTEEQTQELAQATAQFQKYDNAIKAGKKSIGDSREYVGQYERANIGLSNSIGQIARELPAATYGFQTFALGISNNFPIMIDEIKKAIAINEDLIKKNKEVVPVWKQVTSAIFSFNTIMSIGLLLLALYGKEIANFTKELFGANSALEEVNNRQKEFNKARLEGKKDAQTDIIELRKYLAVVKDRSIADDLRQVALKKLRADYPYYFKNLTDEQILTGKTSEAVKQLTKDLEKRKEVDKKTDLNVKNRQRLIDLEKEKELNKDAEKQALKLLEIEKQKPIINDRATAQAQRIKMSEAERVYESAIKKTAKTQEEIDLIQKNTIKNEESIFNLKTETIALEYQDTEAKDKNTKAIKLNTKAREDYLASEYELWRLRKTNQSNLNKEIMDDEASGYELRLLASEQYYQNQLDLANREAQEELRILEFSTQDKIRTVQNEYLNQKEQLDSYLTDGKITREKYNKAIKDAEEQLQYDRSGIIKDATNKQNIIYENQAQNLINTNKEVALVMQKVWDEINFTKAEIQISGVDLSGVEKLKDILASIGDNMSIEQIKGKLNEVNQIANDNSLDMAEREATLELLRKENSKKRLEQEIKLKGDINGLSDDEIANQIINNQALLDLDKEIIDSKKKVLEADNNKTKKQIENQLLLLEETKRVKDEILDAQIELANSISEVANQLFSNEINTYDQKIEKSNEYYDSLLENSEKGSEQERVLQEEKQRKEEELQKKKIEVQRKQAIFQKMLAVAQIGVDLARTIAKIQMEASILMSNPITAALAPMAYGQIPLVLGTAAAQTALVLATPLPQYKDGTAFHPGGKALVGEVQTEVVENPDGSIFLTPNKPTILDLQKGAKVHSSLEDFNKSKFNLENAAIMASFVNQSNQLKAFDYYVAKELNGLSGKIEKGIEKGFKKAKINNNNVNNVYIGRKPSNFFN